jgi:aryl-alcohol dehydrogenase-like predicted oxidoreductase
MMATLGLGGGALGVLDDHDAFRVLDAAVAAGFSLVDLAPSYGDAEARVGRWRRARGSRADALRVVTKGGYGVAGCADWTGGCLHRGAAGARERLAVDVLDGFLLHSCAGAVLTQPDVAAALHAILDDGLARRVGYAGDNADLHLALDRAAALRLSLVEQSLSLLDGHARVHTLPRAVAVGADVIAKRVLANTPWRTRPTPRDDEAHQARRYARAGLAPIVEALAADGLTPASLFLRYALGTPGVTVVLIGTSRIEGIESAARSLADGPLPAHVHEALAPALSRCDDASPV